MNKIKSAFSWILAIALSLGIICSPAYAVEDESYEQEIENTAFNEPVSNSYIEIVESVLAEYGSDDQVSPQWTSGSPDSGNPLTHGYITEVGINVVSNDHSNASSFYFAYANSLIWGSVMPDFDENDSAYAWHFYGQNGKNYLFGDVTAYTKCIEHYNNAVQLYKSGYRYRSSAMEELGRALHYLQDANVPHHVMNKIAVITNHQEFEKEAEENRTSYVVTSMLSSAYPEYGKPLGEIIDYYANIARGWDSKACSSVQSDRAQAEGACIRNAQRATAAVLYKFMDDVSVVELNLP